MDEHIATVCLPPSYYTSTSKNCYATGWGKDRFGKEGKYSVIMKSVSLPIVPNNQCEASLRKTKLKEKFRLDNSFICAGGEDGVDTCEVSFIIVDEFDLFISTCSSHKQFSMIYLLII